MTDGRMHIQADSRPDAGLYLQALQTETTHTVLITEDRFDASPKWDCTRLIYKQKHLNYISSLYVNRYIQD